MNNKLTFTGGEPFMREDDFLRIQQANREFIQNFLEDYGECIVSGAEITSYDDSTIIIGNDGFVYLDGEMLKVDAGTYATGTGNHNWRYKKVTTYESGGDKTYKDGTPHQTWQKNRAIPENIETIGTGDLDCVNGERWIDETDWIEITPDPTYYTQGSTPLQYRKLSSGQIEMKGYVTRIAGPAIQPIATMPLYFRPLSKYNFYAFNISTPSAIITMWIGTDGVIDGSGNTDTGICFDGIIYPIK